jgi:hypothetical protein
MAPLDPSTVRTDQGATVKWRNPTRRQDGEPLDDFAGIRVYRDSVLVAELTRAASDTGSVGQWDDTPPTGSLHAYAVSAFDGHVPARASQRVSAGSAFSGPLHGVLVWRPYPAPPSSGDSVSTTLMNLGKSVDVVGDLNAAPRELNAYEAIFAVLGFGSERHAFSNAESNQLITFVDNGGRLYLECGNCLYDQAPGASLRPRFGLDQWTTLVPIPNWTGAGFLEGLSFSNSSPGVQVNELVATTAAEVMQRTGTTTGAGVALDNGVTRTIATTIPFSALAGSPQDKLGLMWRYITFLSAGSVVDVPAGNGRPLSLSLRTPMPNPVFDRTEIQFELPADSDVRLSVFDITGRRVRTLFEGPKPAGRHSIGWDRGADTADRVSPGIYFVTLNTGEEERRTRVVILGR